MDENCEFPAFATLKLRSNPNNVHAMHDAGAANGGLRCEPSSPNARTPAIARGRLTLFVAVCKCD